jgi:5-methylcytosine-specific restriction protein A
MHRNSGGYCDHHFQDYRKQADQKRESAVGRGYDGRWKKLRDAFLSVNPLCQCERCRAMGRLKPAGIVHHIKPVEVYPGLRLEWNNLRAMDSHCHEVEHGRARDFDYDAWLSSCMNRSMTGEGRLESRR